MATVSKPRRPNFFKDAVQLVANELGGFLASTKIALVSFEQASRAAAQLLPLPKRGIDGQEQYSKFWDSRMSIGKSALRLLESKELAAHHTYSAFDPARENLVRMNDYMVAKVHQRWIRYGLGDADCPELLEGSVEGEGAVCFGHSQIVHRDKLQGYYDVNTWRLLVTSLWLTLRDRGLCNVRVEAGELMERFAEGRTTAKLTYEAENKAPTKVKLMMYGHPVSDTGFWASQCLAWEWDREPDCEIWLPPDLNGPQWRPKASVSE